jgi:hypothetical protein
MIVLLNRRKEGVHVYVQENAARALGFFGRIHDEHTTLRRRGEQPA